MTTIACVGLAVRDLVFAVPHLPQGPGKHFADAHTEIGGGPAANAAVTVSALGASARFIGCLGDDERGNALDAELRSLGVDTTRVRRIPGASSPLSSVYVDGSGDRMIVNHTDRALFSSARPAAEEDVTGSDAVLVDTRWLDGAVAALRAARSIGVPGIVDFEGRTGPATEQILATASHVAFAAPALAGLTGTDDVDTGLRSVAASTEAWLAVTAGERGVYWLEDGSLRHQPAFPVAAVDTLGAGDVFHGALAVGLAHRGGAAAAIRLASAAAAIKCTRFGGRAGIPSRDEVTEFLEERTT